MFSFEKLLEDIKAPVIAKMKLKTKIKQYS